MCVFITNMCNVFVSDNIFSKLSEKVREHFLYDKATNKKSITVDALLELVKEGHFKDISIHEVLEESELQFLPPPSITRNPELEKRVEKLKAEQANLEYRAMTKNLFPQEKAQFSLGADVRVLKAQLAAVVNFVLTVGGSFFFVFKAVEYALPQQNIAAQVLSGLATATVVALADLYFLARTI